MCRIQNTFYKTAQPIHLKVQESQHILQNCPTYTPENPGSPTHATKLPYPCTWMSMIPDTSYRTGLPIHLKVQGPQHILTKVLYPYTWTWMISNISYTTALSTHLNVQCPQHILQNCPLPIHLKVQGPEHVLHNCHTIHLKVQGPQHTLYTSPTHTSGSSESWTHPTHQPYPYAWKSRVPNTSYTRSKILKV